MCAVSVNPTRFGLRKKERLRLRHSRVVWLGSCSRSVRIPSRRSLHTCVNILRIYIKSQVDR